jgi:polyisoprenoid-binding protein YceI
MASGSADRASSTAHKQNGDQFMKTLLVTLSVALLAMGCAKDPSKDVVAAKVTVKKAKADPAAAPAPALKAPPTKKAAVPADTSETAIKKLAGSIVFIGSKVTGSHTNRFNDWSGTVTGTGEKAQIKVDVKTASAEADYLNPKPWSGKLTKHLISEDFFHAAKFPSATFVSTGIAKTKQGGHEVSGNLTIRGVTKQIRFPATIKNASSLSLNAEFSINRKDFGIIYKGKADDLVRDGVVLKLDLRAN